MKQERQDAPEYIPTKALSLLSASLSSVPRSRRGNHVSTSNDLSTRSQPLKPIPRNKLGNAEKKRKPQPCSSHRLDGGCEDMQPINSIHQSPSYSNMSSPWPPTARPPVVSPASRTRKALRGHKQIAYLSKPCTNRGKSQ